jgi:hypothetical protein
LTPPAEHRLETGSSGDGERRSAYNPPHNRTGGPVSKAAKVYQVELEDEKAEFLQKMMAAHGLPDIGKAIRCLINYARENPDKHADMFEEVRCLDC